MTKSSWYFSTVALPHILLFSSLLFPSFIPQIIVGINAATFNANEANSAALKLTIADSLLDKYSIISDLQVTDSPQNLPSPIGPLASLNLRAAEMEGAAKKNRDMRDVAVLGADSQVQVKYTVTSSQSVYTAQQLFTQLSDAVNSGAFTTALVANAQSVGTADIVACSSDTLVAVDLATSDDDESAAATRESLSGGGIFGVVVGVLFIAAMFGGGIYVIWAKRGECYSFYTLVAASRLWTVTFSHFFHSLSSPFCSSLKHFL